MTERACHFEDVPTGATGAVAGTVVGVWDDLLAVYDETDTLSNSSELAARAAEVAAAWVQANSTPRDHAILTGLRSDILPGSQVREVVWRDNGDGKGFITEYASYAPKVDAEGGGGAIDAIKPSILARRLPPSYPRIANIVQVYHSGGTQGDTVSANADGFHAGRLRRWVAGAMAILGDCWIRFVDDHDNLNGDVSATDGDLFGPGRLCGIETSAGSTLPVYLVRRGENTFRLLRGTSTEHMGQTTDWQIAVTVSWFQGADPGATVIVHDPAHSWQDVPTGSEVLAFYNEADERYEVLHADRVVLHARATLDGPLCAETSMVAISWVEGLIAGEFLLPPDTEPTVVINPRKHAGLSSDTVTLRRADNNMPNPTWEIVDVDLHEYEYVSDVFIDGLEVKQRKKTGYHEICSTDETVETIDTAESCEEEE
jgi:hypothetical protein